MRRSREQPLNQSWDTGYHSSRYSGRDYYPDPHRAPHAAPHAAPHSASHAAPAYPDTTPTYHYPSAVNVNTTVGGGQESVQSTTTGAIDAAHWMHIGALLASLQNQLPTGNLPRAS